MADPVEAPPVRHRPLRPAPERDPPRGAASPMDDPERWSATCAWRRSRSSACSRSPAMTGGTPPPHCSTSRSPRATTSTGSSPGRRVSTPAWGRCSTRSSTGSTVLAGGRGLLALRAPAPLGADRPRRARGRHPGPRPARPAARDRHRDQLDRADRRLPGLRRHLLGHGARLVDHPGGVRASGSRSPSSRRSLRARGTGPAAACPRATVKLKLKFGPAARIIAA